MGTCRGRLVRTDVTASQPPSAWEEVIPEHPTDLLQRAVALKVRAHTAAGDPPVRVPATLPALSAIAPAEWRRAGRCSQCAASKCTSATSRFLCLTVQGGAAVETLAYCWFLAGAAAVQLLRSAAAWLGAAWV